MNYTRLYIILIISFLGTSPLLANYPDKEPPKKPERKREPRRPAPRPPDIIDTDKDDGPLSDLVIPIGEQIGRTRKDPSKAPAPPVPLLTTEEFEELERLLAYDDEDSASGERKTYTVKGEGLTEIRKKLISVYQGTGDLAGVAECLLKLGAGLTYDQTSASELSAEEQKNYVASSAGSDLLGASRGSCYEFIHFVAWLAGSGTKTLHNVGGGLLNLLNPATMKEWDGQSAIPRGHVVVGCVGYDKDSVKTWFGGTPQDNFGFIHVGISLGGGKVVSNRGDGSQIETVENVFGEYRGGLSGGKVYIGQYDGYGLTSKATEFVAATKKGIQELANAKVDTSPITDADTTPAERLDSIKLAKDSIRLAKGRLAVLKSLEDNTPIENPTEDQKQFKKFYMEGISAAGSRPFYYHSFEEWMAGNQTAQDLSGKDATALPPEDYSAKDVEVITPLLLHRLEPTFTRQDPNSLSSIAPVPRYIQK